MCYTAGLEYFLCPTPTHCLQVLDIPPNFLLNLNEFLCVCQALTAAAFPGFSFLLPKLEIAQLKTNASLTISPKKN